MSVVQNGHTSAPYVEIIEQPSKVIRFRYKSEAFLSVILGESSTDLKKSHLSIRIVNYKGPAVVVVSCVTKNPPFFPHPHNLVGKAGEVSNGICCLKSHSQDMVVSFINLGIQCVKQKDIEKSLAIRKRLKIDPFKTGFEYVDKAESIDLYSLRLCFQVFVEGREKGNFNVPLPPIVSEPINDKRCKAEPVINYISHTSETVSGGTAVCVLCERISRDDVKVIFFDEEHNWEASAELIPPKVFKKISIVFKVPPYLRRDIENPVTVNIKLLRISDDEESEPYKFIYLPPLELKRKRKRPDVISLTERIQAEAEKHAALKRFTTQVHNKLPEVNSRDLPVFLQRPVDSEQPSIQANEFSKKNDEIPTEGKTADPQFDSIHKTTGVAGENTQNLETTDALTSDHWIRDLFESVKQNYVPSWALPIKGPREVGTSFASADQHTRHNNMELLNDFGPPRTQQNGSFLPNVFPQGPTEHLPHINQRGGGNKQQEFQNKNDQFCAMNNFRSNARSVHTAYSNNNLQNSQIYNQYDNSSMYNYTLNQEHFARDSTPSHCWNVNNY